MRCISYAKELSFLGLTVDLAGDFTIPWVKTLVEETSFLNAANADFTYDLIILDSYDFHFLENVMQKFSFKKSLQLIDKSSPFCLVDKFVWLDAELPSEHGISSDSLLASGIAFMAVRNHGKYKRPIKRAQRVLVTLGGQPNIDHLEALLSTICLNSFSKVSFDVFAQRGFGFPAGENIKFHEIGTQLDKIVQFCDTAITASGTSLWDYLANSLCVGAICTVENQRLNFNYSSKERLSIPLGDFTKSKQIDVDALNELLFNPTLRVKLIARCEDSLDLQGAERLAKRIFSFIRQS